MFEIPGGSMPENHHQKCCPEAGAQKYSGHGSLQRGMAIGIRMSIEDLGCVVFMVSQEG